MEGKKSFTLVEVRDKKSLRAFLDFPARLYRDDKKWGRPLDIDVEKIFDPKQNKRFRKGGAVRWILKDQDHQVVGRVASFYDQSTAKKNVQLTGGLGFFDCINDREAAFTLFDACRDWLKDKGMSAMDGPINFGERDAFWGCLVDGYHEPLYNMPYNFPYYKELFEAYGFKNYFNQYTYHRTFEKDDLSEEIRDKAKRVFDNPDYTFEIFSKAKIHSIAEDFKIIFNAAWARFPGITEISNAHALVLLRQMQPIMDNRLVHIAYYKGDPVGFFIMMPDISQVFRKFNGKLNLINKLRLMYSLRVSKSVTRIIGRLFGVVPQHQGRGVEGGMVMAFSKYANRPNFQYTDLELNWIGDFNPTMMKVCEQIGSRIYKTHITYRFLFDRNASFERAKKVNI